MKKLHNISDIRPVIQKTKFGQAISAEMNQICETILSSPFENITVYKNWLAQTYHFVCHSTRLLAFAASHLKVGLNKEFKRMTEHIGEENGHEKLAEMDLKNLDDSIENYKELGLTKAFYMTQYYGVQKYGPNFLFGYIFLLEAIAALTGPQLYEKLAPLYGENATRFLKVHAQEDQEHIVQALNMIEALDTEQSQFVYESFLLSTELYKHLIQEVSLTEGRSVTRKKIA